MTAGRREQSRAAAGSADDSGPLSAALVRSGPPPLSPPYAIPPTGHPPGAVRLQSIYKQRGAPLLQPLGPAVGVAFGLGGPACSHSPQPSAVRALPHAALKQRHRCKHTHRRLGCSLRTAAQLHGPVGAPPPAALATSRPARHACPRIFRLRRCSVRWLLRDAYTFPCGQRQRVRGRNTRFPDSILLS